MRVFREIIVAIFVIFESFVFRIRNCEILFDIVGKIVSGLFVRISMISAISCSYRIRRETYREFIFLCFSFFCL